MFSLSHRENVNSEDRGPLSEEKVTQRQEIQTQGGVYGGAPPPPGIRGGPTQGSSGRDEYDDLLKANCFLWEMQRGS